MFNPNKTRQDFPILSRQFNGKPLIYLDSAASSQKPRQVLQAMSDYYEQHNANIHRGVYQLAEESTIAYEKARQVVAQFIEVDSQDEIIFTRNTTESLNLIAYAWGLANVRKGDEIILTEMEHHSNLVPWQLIAQRTGATLEFITVNENGELNWQEDLTRLLSSKTKLVSLVHISNALGTINPITKITKAVKQFNPNIIVAVDGAQSVPHQTIDVKKLGCDFLAFSGHKMCGPMGIGVLWGKKAVLEAMPPFLGGGDMIKKVKLRSFSPNDLPHKFEAGTPAIAEAIGLGAAVEYLESIVIERISTHEKDLITYALERLSEVPGLTLLGPEAKFKGGVASFIFKGAHPHDVAQILDHEGIAVRAGHHCAMPLHEKFGLPASTRASFYLYNTREEIDFLIKSLENVIKIFGKG